MTEGSGGRAVVTGGAGFIGSHISRALLGRGWEVIVLDNLLTGRLDNIEDLLPNAAFTFEHYDVTNYVHVDGAVDAVLHLASPASPEDYLEHPIKTLKVGSLGTHNALGLARAKGSRFLLASTSEVYGDPLVHPQPESYWGNVNPVGPRGVYDEAKRFSEAMTLAYHRAHGVAVRIVRIFNSVLADEQVLYDDGTELRRETIGELAERLGRPSADLEGYQVPAFGSDARIGPREAIALVGHPPTGPCFEVTTRYGRTIRVTGDHSLFVEGSDGSPAPRTVTELCVGDRIAIAGRIDVPERDRRDVRMTHVADSSGFDPWNLDVAAPGLGALGWERRFEIFNVIERHRRPPGTAWRNSIWARIRANRKRDQVALPVLRELGIPIPSGAHVRIRTSGRTTALPEQIELTDELLWVLGLFVAEGCWHRSDHDSYVNFACDVDTLERVEKILERETGVRAVWGKGSASRSPSAFFHSKLLVALLDHLGFITPEKRVPGWVLGLPLSRLKWFIEGYREGDGVHSGKKFEAAVRHEFSTTSTALKDDLVIALGRFGIVPSVGHYDTTLKQKTGARRHPFWRLTVPHVQPWSPLAWDGGVEQRLQSRRTGDIVWAAVRAIEEVAPTELVYDFSVPGAENFLAGGAVMAHNTYGPNLRPADGRVVSNFLVQAMDGKPLTIYGDGTQTRSFCYVDDEVRGLLALLGSDTVGPVNIGNPGEYTILELAEAVLEVTGSSSEIVHEPLPVDDPTRRRPDITLAKAALGWEPEIDLRTGLRRTFEWYREERRRGRA